MKKVLVVAAHPDDEVLGCGGTIAKLSSLGVEIHLLIAAEGLTSRQDSRNRNKIKNELESLKKKTKKISKILGIRNTEFLEFPDNRMDSIDRIEITKKIEEKLKTFKAEAIFTHFPNDLNVDHRRLAEATLTAARPLPGQSVKKIYYFEVLSSTNWNFPVHGQSSFSPNVYFDISGFLEKKLSALKVYDSEMRNFPHSRSYKSIESLAYLRGSTVGVSCAEAFVLAREIL